MRLAQKWTQNILHKTDKIEFFFIQMPANQNKSVWNRPLVTDSWCWNRLALSGHQTSGHTVILDHMTMCEGFHLNTYKHIDT